MYVACSTLCFARHSFEDALGAIAELQFTKFEAALHESGPHLRPSEVAADVTAAAARLALRPRPGAGRLLRRDRGRRRRTNTSVSSRPSVGWRASTAVPLLTLSAAPAGSGLDVEVRRLTRLTTLAAKEGVQVTVATRVGTLTEDPEVALALCERVPGLGLTLDPSHYIAGPHHAKDYDDLFPHVRHVHLRDTGRGANQFQVRVGQGEVEYGRIVSHLARCDYDRLLSVDIRDTPDADFAMQPEVRKLKYLLESLV